MATTLPATVYKLFLILVQRCAFGLLYIKSKQSVIVFIFTSNESVGCQCIGLEVKVMKEPNFFKELTTNWLRPAII